MAAWQQLKQAVRLKAAISQWAQLTDLPKTLAWINSRSSFQPVYYRVVCSYIVTRLPKWTCNTLTLSVKLFHLITTITVVLWPQRGMTIFHKRLAGIHPFGKRPLSYYSETSIWHPRLLAHHQTIWQASCLSVCLVWYSTVSVSR